MRYNLIICLAFVILLAGCRSANWHRDKADRAAHANLEVMQMAALNRTEPIKPGPAEDALRARLLQAQNLPGFLEPAPEAPPEPDAQLAPLHLDPIQALQVAARNSRDFQQAKERLFSTALGLNLEQDAFRTEFSSRLSATFEEDRSGEESVRGVYGVAPLQASHSFRNGIEWTGSLAVDLVKLLTQGSASSLGLLADTGITIPLLRGSGQDIAAEPLRQAERDLLYAVMDFERFKRQFAFDTLSGYLDVLQGASQIENAEQNYESLIRSRKRARRLADAGRLPEFQYDQTVQDELRARNRWIDARAQYASRLDRFKLELGLPPDAQIVLDNSILPQLTETFTASVDAAYDPDQGGQTPIPGFPNLLEQDAMQLALQNRLDLQIARMRVEDAERKIRVAEDALRAELTLGGSVRTGSSRSSLSAAELDDARLDLNRRRSNAFLTLDLPFNRRQERVAYRRSLLAKDASRRDAEQTEDRVKLEIRDAVRRLYQTREALRIQEQAATLAERRVHSTDMFLQAGRAQIRDVLEAREALVNARNALIGAAVNHRIAVLRFQRDADVLDISIDGVMQEYAHLTATETNAADPIPDREGN